MNEPQATEGELAILRVLWDRGQPCTVREVHEALSRNKETAYTTVLKMMTIMTEKGLLARDESERSHRYRPTHDEPQVQSAMLKDFMRRTFAGSAAQLVQRALDADAASAADLDAIEDMIRQAKARRGR
ncbi:BlaI/MecI/CopY family transcriptional regulator [Chitinimonas koreensis]|uniref:BlaI/MecI/CopY family transcriptional regulator n=1 Tax=Chitinimonas koreensis TaxID=356302 RepID=UPI000428B938|nr:BlaI/MecI/CopY family transcriptional regulator [Chitinimonas koreensis]QNM96593.1 BlaI/MecI/CopY family transcriptional regulator [Chitinimonas koreensis]